MESIGKFVLFVEDPVDTNLYGYYEMLANGVKVFRDSRLTFQKIIDLENDCKILIKKEKEKGSEIEKLIDGLHYMKDQLRKIMEKQKVSNLELAQNLFTRSLQIMGKVYNS